MTWTSESHIDYAKYAAKIVYPILDALSILYLLDFLTFCISTNLVESMLYITLNLHRWRMIRWTFILYATYRVGIIAFHRYKVHARLTSKRNDLMDKHGRMNEKLKTTIKPRVSAEEVSKWSVSELRQKLVSKSISAVDVIDAYQRRALEIFQRRPGCVSEIVFDADVYAILADCKFQEEVPEGEESPKLSPLLGIPVGVQEIFPVRGCDHTMGFVSRANKPAEDDCALVAALKEAGAVPFVLTNYRQKTLGLTAQNPIFGKTRHPSHPHRACVSGDGALLQYHGVPLTFAADTLGEARLSAAFCGMAAFKPSSGRMTQMGVALPLQMPHALGVIASPMAHTMQDIEDAMRSLWTQVMFKNDTSLCPLPFNETKFNRGRSEPLKIGIYTGFEGILNSSSAVERVVQEAKRVLESKGHTVIEFNPPEVDKAYQLVMSILASTLIPETLRVIYKEGHGDIMVDYKRRLLHTLYYLPSLIRNFLCRLRAVQIKSDYAVTALALRGLGNTRSYAELELAAHEFSQTFFEKWNDLELDCLLCPVSPIPAAWDNSAFYVVNSVYLFTALYNMLGCPAGTVRVGRVEKPDIETAKEMSVGIGEGFRERHMFSHQLDEAEGLPINVQVVAKPWDDELAMGVLHTLEEAMQTPNHVIV